MNGFAAKATRREIRRAFGDGAVDAFGEMQKAQEAQSSLIASLGGDMLTMLALKNEYELFRTACEQSAADTLQRLTNLNGRQQSDWASLYDYITTEAKARLEFQHRTLYGRLKWLLTGK